MGAQQPLARSQSNMRSYLVWKSSLHAHRITSTTLNLSEQVPYPFFNCPSQPPTIQPLTNIKTPRRGIRLQINYLRPRYQIPHQRLPNPSIRLHLRRRLPPNQRLLSLHYLPIHLFDPPPRPLQHCEIHKRQRDSETHLRLHRHWQA